ncbi:MAG: alpha-ribazole phosphatase [Heliobacteriaceae bacterium]|nr:alpha-ribazole phosphatase [Heliobacteriaceae bacterium]MDD4587902.1 alpha-ribazole phosphatase [Heliobacteriaceae bacterium]
MTRVFLIRHGETEWNQTGRYQGHSDVALSEKGRNQAERLAWRLKDGQIDRIYASDLERAVETAGALAARLNKPVIREARFRECNFGAWEGLTFAEIAAAYPREIQVWRQTPGRLNLPDGESFALVQKRAYQALQEVVAKHPGAGVAVFAHGGTIRTLLCSILGLELDRAWQLRQDNTALNIVTFHDGLAIVERLNDTAHLLPGAFPQG